MKTLRSALTFALLFGIAAVLYAQGTTDPGPVVDAGWSWTAFGVKGILAITPLVVYGLLEVLKRGLPKIHGWTIPVIGIVLGSLGGIVSQAQANASNMLIGAALAGLSTVIYEVQKRLR